MTVFRTLALCVAIAAVAAVVLPGVGLSELTEVVMKMIAKAWVYYFLIAFAILFFFRRSW